MTDCQGPGSPTRWFSRGSAVDLGQRLLFATEEDMGTADVFRLVASLRELNDRLAWD